MAKTNTIITIGREYGSAGREIGYKVADYFGIKLYDKEMLARAAKESGICQELSRTVPVENNLNVAFRSVMGVEIPKVHYTEQKLDFCYGMEYANSKLDYAYSKIVDGDPAGIHGHQDHRALSDARMASYVMIELQRAGLYHP